MNDSSATRRSGGANSAASPAAYAATAGLPGERVILPTADALIDRLATDLMNLTRMRLPEAGRFHLALSGGKTPEALFTRLVIDPQFRSLPWEFVEIWIVDERCVEPEDDRCNFKMIRESLLDHVPVDEFSVHRMLTELPDGDTRYEADLRRLLGPQGRIDALLLGMGADGHTASLFPHTPALDERGRWVVFNDGPTIASPRPRMTMTYPLINSARFIAPLLTGQAKYAMLQTLQSPGAGARDYPILGIKPSHADGKLVWYLDEPAATGK